MGYSLGKPLGFIQRYLRQRHPMTMEIYLKSLGGDEENRQGKDEVIFPRLDHMKEEQGGLINGSVFNQLWKTCSEAIVINLDEARKTREGAGRRSSGKRFFV